MHADMPTFVVNWWFLLHEKGGFYYLLKVPKREIFDGSDFPDFYTIKSLRVGDFGVKIKNCFKNI
jgi:hypothetical protein